MSEFEHVARGLPADGSISLDFGVALEALKFGKRVWRRGWNRNTIRVLLTKVPLAVSPGEEESFLTVPVMVDELGKALGAWHPSPTDLMAEDWHFE